MSDSLTPSRDQLGRSVIVYIRQSSALQVARNTESRERQYELVEKAISLGWRRDQVVVIDEDLGRSGSEAAGRSGFQRLVAEVALRRVGLVIGIEVSRLARRSADWHQLMDLCALTDTLIADADGIYHPGEFNTQLLLGLKGTMAQAELHLIRSRMTGARLHKAAKGELRLLLPVGLDYDDDGNVVLSPDESVRAAIGEVFSRFERLTSARQVLLSLRSDGLKLPQRRPGTRPITWTEAGYRAVHEILVKPAYAGAYVFGRTRQHRSVDEAGNVRSSVRAVEREGWQVCIPGHHEGYIDWERFLANQERLLANRARRRGDTGGAPREGAALLVGLVRCGRCGRKMHVGYWGASARLPAYSCARAAQETGSAKPCQRIAGRRVDEAVVDAVFEALQPASLQATAKALSEAEDEHARAILAFETALERARYEAERARRQFDAVEPENRLVGRGLESAWEDRLAEVHRAEMALAARRANRPAPLSAQELGWLERAGADLRRVFHAESTTPAERKQLLRAVLSEVRITVDPETRRASLDVCFEGGAVLKASVEAPRKGWHVPATAEDTVDLVRRLAEHYDDTEIARILSRQGRRTATGLDFTRERVNALRNGRGIPACRPTPGVQASLVSLTEARRLLGVSDATIYRWLRAGFITGTQLTPGGRWHLRVDDALRAKLVPDLPPGWVRLNEAAALLGVARQTVLDRVRRGELRAVEVMRGQRRGLAIEVGRAEPAGRLFSPEITGARRANATR